MEIQVSSVCAFMNMLVHSFVLRLLHLEAYTCLASLHRWSSGTWFWMRLWGDAALMADGKMEVRLPNLADSKESGLYNKADSADWLGHLAFADDFLLGGRPPPR